MKKSLIRLVIILLYKINWRKLLVIGAITTATGLIYITSILPFPITARGFHQTYTISSRESLDNTHITQLTAAKIVEQVQPRQTSPSVTLNSTLNEGQIYKDSRKGRALRRRKRKKRGHWDYADYGTPPPPPEAPPTALETYIRTLPPNEQLLYAKRELLKAPIISNDSELYAPIFKNISTFKRSYELMELILKVYIYPDGEGPIFHHPSLSGIYASEGWFMKIMEANKHFVTPDPELAHLFYLPYSSRQLQQALYVVGSHNLRPLAEFMRDHVNMLASKYPYWNRTHGSDHFLVACHDWGPYTTTMHDELARNTIKALCNADISEGIFKPGKDVSLPETTIRLPRRPRRNVGGGVRVSKRPILAFFAGSNHGPLRPVLFKHWRDKDDDIKVYEWLPAHISRKMSYIQHMRSSKFCLCPMGYEVNSPRIVEAIYYECVPVIIADDFPPPLSDVLHWSAFSLTVPEKDIAKLKEILLAVPIKRYLKMLANLKMLQRHFLWNFKPVKYDLFHMILHSIWFNRLNQIQIPESES